MLQRSLAIWLYVSAATALAATPEKPLPQASGWTEPLRGLLDSDEARTGSFGVAVDKEKFGEETRHVGIDCGWFKGGEAVYAIGAGRVRYCGAVPTVLYRQDDPKAKTGFAVPWIESPVRKWGWGGLVIIEHALPPKTKGGKASYVCSLYGHLGKKLLVKEGQDVAAGEKLGDIGDGPSDENGWYRPHLHWGIYEGPYLNPPSHMPVKLDGKELQCRVLALDDKNVYVDVRGRREAIAVKRYWEWFLVPNTSGRLYPKWVTGYIRREEDLEKSGWRDPVKFLRAAKRGGGDENGDLEIENRKAD